MSSPTESEFSRLSAASLSGRDLHQMLRAEDSAHAQRVADLCFAMAVAMNQSSDAAAAIAAAAHWHDVGKVVVDPMLLNKPAALTPHEKMAVDRHVWHGYSILQLQAGSNSELAATVALLHHERFNGGGHPFALRAEAIPLIARITSVADVYDALISVRPYKPAWPRDQVLAHIDAERGRHFDPACVDALFAVLEVGGSGRLLHRGLAGLAQLRVRGRQLTGGNSEFRVV